MMEGKTHLPNSYGNKGIDLREKDNLPILFELKKTERIAYWVKSFKEKLRRLRTKAWDTAC